MKNYHCHNGHWPGSVTGVMGVGGLLSRILPTGDLSKGVTLLWLLAGFVWIYMCAVSASILNRPSAYREVPDGHTDLRRSTSHIQDSGNRRLVFHTALHEPLPDQELVSWITKSADGELAVEDMTLVWYIGTKLVGPSSGYPRSKNITDFSEYGQSRTIDRLLGRRTKGVFFEVGCGSGLFLSNTFFLEKNRKWTGLLVEADMVQYKVMLWNRRRAMSLNGCVSSDNTTRFMALSQHKHKHMSTILGPWSQNVSRKFNIHIYHIFTV